MEDEKDLYFKYKFTDRGGARVYDVYPQCDHMTMKYKIGQVRLKDSDIEREGEPYGSPTAGGTG